MELIATVFYYKVRYYQSKVTSTVALSCQSHNISSKLFHLLKTTLEQSSSF